MLALLDDKFVESPGVSRADGLLHEAAVGSVLRALRV